METNFDKMKQEPNAGNPVIERGYEIYDEWVKHRYSSRKIVRFTERVVASLQAQRASAVYFEALSCLFALDIRIQKKYNCFLKCVFSCFSWRREMRAFKLLMETVHIPGSNADIRIAIEVAFEQLREKLEAEDADDKDDTVHGGKSQGRLEEELSANREKWQNQTTNDNPEAISNMEEAKAVAEEKTDKISEFLQKHEQVEQIEIQQNEREAPSQKEETSVQKKTEPVKEKIQEIKVENNASDEKSERNLDILKETKTYNNGIVSPLLYEHKMTDNAKSFMDEVITDNAVKSKGDVAERNPLENEKSVWETSPVGDVSNEKSKNINKDAYLYDEMLTNDRGDTAQNGKVAANKQEAEDLRVPLQVDITLDQENEIRREINRSMSIEAIQAFYESQAEAMREQLTIASAELGIDAPVEIVGKQKSTKIEQPSAVSNRK